MMCWINILDKASVMTKLQKPKLIPYTKTISINLPQCQHINLGAKVFCFLCEKD